MPRYLLAAEADRIQDLIFRSSKLREIVGGSQLLTRFCHEAPGVIGSEGFQDENIIVADGGAFRLVFDGELIEAKRLLAQIAELYHRVTGGAFDGRRTCQIRGLPHRSRFRTSPDETSSRQGTWSRSIVP